MKSLLHRAARGLLLLLLAAAIPHSARAQDGQVEAGFEDDLTVKGTGGTQSDPDAEVWGYALFGTNGSAAVLATSGVGSVFFQNHIEAGSNAYIHGSIASGSATGFQINASGNITRIQAVAYNWPTNQGAANTFLRNDSAGNLTWAYPIPVNVTFFSDETTVIWANQPAALTEFLGTTRYRTKYDLSYATDVRFTVFVATTGATTALLGAQYSTDQVTWAYMASTNSPVVNLSNATLQVTGWSNLVSGARTDVYIRLVGSGGNGVADPALGAATLQFR